MITNSLIHTLDLSKDFNISIETVEAWEEFNREGFGKWADPGSYIQYHIIGPNNTEIWIMRIHSKYTNELCFWLDFGPHPSSKDDIPWDVVVTRVSQYLISKGIIL